LNENVKGTCGVEIWRQKGSSWEDVKHNNVAVVLGAIRRFGPISRTELAEMTDLTSGTITNVTSLLLELGLISEAGSAASRGGRKRVLLKLREDAFLSIGVEISRQHVFGVLANLDGKVVSRAEEPTKTGEGPAQTITRVVQIITRFREDARRLGYPVIGAGIGVPGPVKTEEGIVTTPPNFPGWRWIRLKDQIESRTGLKVFIDDDARTAALGEAWFGAGRDAQSLVYISVGSGIGAGVVVRGRLYQGVRGLAGQIGHTSVDPHGARCECGNVGCLELFAAAPGIVRQARERLRAGEPSVLAEYEEAGDLTINRICKSAEAGDLVAVSVMETACTYLGTGVANVINAYDPEMIILGGSLVRAYDILVDRVRAIAHERSFVHGGESTQIVRSKLGKDVSAIGAVALVLERFFGDPLGALAQVGLGDPA